jgi:hypothetical protein
MIEIKIVLSPISFIEVNIFSCVEGLIITDITKKELSNFLLFINCFYFNFMLGNIN